MPDDPIVIDVQNYHDLFWKALPKEVTMSNGDVIPIPWFDAEEVIDYDEHPYGTFAFLWESLQDETHRHYQILEPEELQETETDTITYNDGTDTYLVVNRDIASIVSVTGTLSGSPGHVFVEGVDYEVTLSDDVTHLNDSITWLAGDRPDDATTFDVEYKHIVGREHRVVRSTITVRLTIHAKKLEAGENGATIHYPRTHLANMLGQYVLTYMRLKQGEGLIPGDPGGLVVGRSYVVGMGSIDRASSVHRNTIDLFLKRKYRAEAGRFFFIGKASLNTTFE